MMGSPTHPVLPAVRRLRATESPTSLFRLRRRDLAKVALLAVLQAITLAAVLLSVRSLVDQMTKGPLNPAGFYRLAALLALAVLANAVLRGVEFTVSEKIGYALVRGLRMKMYRHLQGMSMRQLQGRSRGGLLYALHRRPLHSARLDQPRTGTRPRLIRSFSSAGIGVIA